MKEKYVRTTITRPTDLYRKSRIEAARNGKSLSGFMKDMLRSRFGGEHIKRQKLPLGKYNFPMVEVLRKDIYDDFLRRKISR